MRKRAEIKTVKFRRKPNPEIEVIGLERLTSVHRDTVIQPHRADFYHVFLFEDCSAIHTLDFIQIPVSPFSLLFIDRNRVHQFDGIAAYKGKVVVFTEDFFSLTERDSLFLKTTTLFNELVDQPSLSLGREGMSKFFDVARMIELELNSPGRKGAHDALKNLLHCLLLWAEREKAESLPRLGATGSEIECALRFKGLLETKFRKHKSVAYYAGSMFVSEKKLCRSTLRTMGKSPKTLIDDRVLLEAKRILAHGSQSTTELAFHLGFDEPTNFTKYFRKHMGMTPLEFRRSTHH